MKKEPIILLAEDNEPHARLIIRNLKRAGIENEILHFNDGEEILNYLLKDHPEDGAYYILLLDIRMPKINGIEVLRKVKEDNRMSKFPVIMITTANEPGTVSKCYEMGCDRYIIKPVNHGEFVETINQLAQFLRTIEVPVPP